MQPDAKVKVNSGEIPTAPKASPIRNIMQDLVKNLARIWQESGKIWQDFLTFLTYLVRFLQESYKNILVRSY